MAKSGSICGIRIQIVWLDPDPYAESGSVFRIRIRNLDPGRATWNWVFFNCGRLHRYRYTLICFIPIESFVFTFTYLHTARTIECCHFYLPTVGTYLFTARTSGCCHFYLPTYLFTARTSGCCHFYLPTYLFTARTIEWCHFYLPTYLFTVRTSGCCLPAGTNISTTTALLQVGTVRYGTYLFSGNSE